MLELSRHFFRFLQISIRVFTQVNVSVVPNCVHFLHADLQLVLGVLSEYFLQNFSHEQLIVVLAVDVQHTILSQDLHTGVLSSQFHMYMCRDRSVSLDHSFPESPPALQLFSLTLDLSNHLLTRDFAFQKVKIVSLLGSCVHHQPR